LFIGKDIRLDPVILKDQTIKNLLEYYMGKNTPDRQQHIIRNLRIEKDTIEELVSADAEAATAAVSEDIVEIAESA
jgi:topoisomerase-4 subunit B